MKLDLFSPSHEIDHDFNVREQIIPQRISCGKSYIAQDLFYVLAVVPTP